MLILKNKPVYLEELVVILEFLIVFNICMIFQVYKPHLYYYYVYQSARAALPKYHKLSDLNYRTVLSHSFGGQKSRIEVLLGLLSSMGCEEELLSGLLPSFWWVVVWQPLAFHSLYTYHPVFCPHLHMAFSLSACLCSNFPILLGHQSYWIQPCYSNMISSQ